MILKTLLPFALCFSPLTWAHEVTDYEFTDALLYSQEDVLGEDLAPMATTKTLGSAVVGGTIKRYSIRIPNCARNITHVKITVSDGDLYAESVGAHFTEGADKTYNVNRTLEAGYVGPWLPMSMLVSGNRCIDRVYVRAKAADPRVPARLKLLGSVEE